MGAAREKADREKTGLEAIREVVPGRAVLTELARGFLLVQESNRERAVQFAATFLRECTGTAPPERIEGTRPVTVARLRFGRSGRGPVEPTNGPP
ncbi:MAG TPA: hypothetical protein VEL82_03085 [Thermoplasmata archaeon]|nr:hypothetical protein [Thermoplasmata archaeon]